MAVNSLEAIVIQSLLKEIKNKLYGENYKTRNNKVCIFEIRIEITTFTEVQLPDDLELDFNVGELIRITELLN